MGPVFASCALKEVDVGISQMERVRANHEQRIWMTLAISRPSQMADLFQFLTLSHILDFNYMEGQIPASPTWLPEVEMISDLWSETGRPQKAMGEISVYNTTLITFI